MSLFHSFLLGKHDEEMIERYEELAEQVETEYPFVLATLFDRYHEAVADLDLPTALESFYECFELGLPFTCAIILHEFRRMGVKGADLVRVVEHLHAKPLALGDWLVIFKSLLEVEAEQLPELVAAFRAFSHRGSKLTPFGRWLFGGRGIAPLRNDRVHGTRPTQEHAKTVLIEHETWLFTYLEALGSLVNHPTFTVRMERGQVGEEREYSINIMVGTGSRRGKIRSRTPLALEQLYLLETPDIRRARSEDIVPLLPLGVCMPYQDEPAAKRIVYLYQGVANKKRDKLWYASPAGQPRKATHRFNEQLESFVCWFRGDKPDEAPGLRSPEASRSWTWPELLGLGRQHSERFLGAMRREKYDPELFVPRAGFDRAMARFLDMPQRPGFALLGNAGSGKTNVLCRLTEQLQDQGHLVLTWYAKAFADVDPADELRQLFKTEAPDDLLPQLDALAEQAGKQVFFIIDAVNECVPGEPGAQAMNPARLVERMDRLLAAPKLPRVRVVLSCRSYTWEEAQSQRGHSLSAEHWFTTRDLEADPADETEEIALGRFSEEEFASVYPIYQRRYGLLTDLATLQLPAYRRTRWELRDPFRLRMAARCYGQNNKTGRAGREIPAREGSLELLERLYKEQVLALDDGHEGRHVRALLLFSRHLHQLNSDSLELMALERLPTHDELRSTLLTAAGKLSPEAGGLIDAGILRCEESTAFHELRFVYDRFHEFALGRVLLQELAGAPDPLEFFEQQLARVGVSAVAWGGICNALVLHLRAGRDQQVLARLAASEAYGAQGVVVQVLGRLVQEDWSLAHQGLMLLLRTPGEARRGIKQLTRIADEMEDLQGTDYPRTRARLEDLNRERRELTEALVPLVRTKKTAAKVLYDVYRSPYYTEALYEEGESPLELLWLVLADPLEKVRDLGTRLIYYLWKEHTEVAMAMLQRLGQEYLGHTIFTRYKRRHLRQQVEPCARLSALLMADAIVTGEGRELLPQLQELWHEIIKAITIKGLALPLLTPMVKAMVRRGGQDIAAYVNNLREYQHFWDELKPRTEGYTARHFAELTRFLDPDEPGFAEQADIVVQGAALGDAFNNFLLERVLIAQGVRGYENIAETVDRIYHNPDNLLPEYTQMSMLYVVFHTLDKMETIPEEPLRRYETYMEPWTESFRGRFEGHYAQQANAEGLYKQYSLNWYGALWAKHEGDGQAELPLFRDYLEEAFEDRDRELMLYVIDNIATLAADFGYWRSALGLFEHALSLFTDPQDLTDFDDPAGGPDMRTVLAQTLATIRGYFGKEVDRFVKEELATTRFPDFEDFREELQRHEAGETIGDLLTHKVGNFFVHGIVFEPEVRRHFQHLLRLAVEQNGVDYWMGDVVAPYLLDLFMGLKA